MKNSRIISAALLFTAVSALAEGDPARGKALTGACVACHQEDGNGRDYGDYNYGGACPPPGHGTHRYIFTIHALDCEHLDLPEDTTTARVGFNVWVHSLGSASLTGTFSR